MRPLNLVFALALGLALCPTTGHSTISVRDLWAPNGEVRAVARAGNTLYMGGSFSHVGPVSGPAVAIDAATAVAQAPYPRVAGYVTAVEPDGNGGWYIGGHFTAVQGQRRMCVAQIDADGQVTSWNPEVNGTVYDIAVGGGVVYVVGSFTSVSNWGAGVVDRYGAAALDATTGVPTHWDPNLNDMAFEVEVGGGKVYVAGIFKTVYFFTSQQPRLCLAEFTEVIPGDISSGALTGRFAGSDPSLIEVSALELSGGKLFIGSRYVSNSNLRVYDQVAGSYLPYALFGGPIHDVAFDPGTGIFFVGGSFASFSGQFHGNLAVFHVATGNSANWNTGTDGPVRTLTMSSHGLLVGGDFTRLGVIPRQSLGLVNPVSSTVLPWDPATGGLISAIEVDGERVYVGGDFSIVNSVPRSNLAAMDEASGALLPWSPTTDDMVEALLVSGSTVYVGGKFLAVNGETRRGAAAVDAVTGALTAFNPNVGVFPSRTVGTLAISGSTLYMGGTFPSINGVGRVGIAAVDAVTGDLMTWDALSNGAVRSITYVDGGIFGGPLLVVGGDFTSIGGQPRNYLATLDPVAATSGPLDSPNAPVHSVLVEPLPPGYGGYNQIYIGGDFTSVAGQPRNHLASLAGFGLVTSWNPDAYGIVYSIAKVGSIIYVGGSFTRIGGFGGQDRSCIAAIDASGAPTPWNPYLAGGFPPDAVYSLLESGGTLYVGGRFGWIAETPHSHFAGLSQVVTAVESEPVRDATPMAVRAAPNPFEQSTVVQFSLPSGGKTSVAVFDVAGRRVRELHNGYLPSGRHTMPWDGLDVQGRPVAVGVYFLGVRTQTGRLGSKIYRLK